MDEISPLAIRLKDIEQDLKTKKEKIRVLEKKIDALEKKKMILIVRFKTREEIISSRDRNIAAVQDYDKILKKKLERKKLVIAIVANMIKLLNLSFTVKR
jgi:hypothetical protein